MGIFRMFTGDDGQSVMKELQQDDPILEPLKTCTGCFSSDQRTHRVFRFPSGTPTSLDDHAKRTDRYPVDGWNYS